MVFLIIASQCKELEQEGYGSNVQHHNGQKIGLHEVIQGLAP